nr:hypothetical protein [uncultured Sphingomonas sp.]
MAARSKRRLQDCKGLVAITVHPTKGYRRISASRIVAQGRIPHMIRTWSLLGAAVQ